MILTTGQKSPLKQSPEQDFFTGWITFMSTTTQDLTNQPTTYTHPHTHIIVMAAKWQFSQINLVCQLPLTTKMRCPYPFRSHNIKSDKAQ